MTDLFQRHRSRPTESIGIAMIVAALLAHVWFQSQSPRAESTRVDTPRACAQSPFGQRLMRTDLFLGMAKPDGSMVSDTEFQRFIDSELTPRFPDGFTVVPGSGQFKDARGEIVREGTRVLIVLYPGETGQGSEAIEKVRVAYKAQYQQESVLRVDEESCVSF